MDSLRDDLDLGPMPDVIRLVLIEHTIAVKKDRCIHEFIITSGAAPSGQPW